MIFLFNRQGIRKALENYNESVKQHEGILNNAEIQQHYEKAFYLEKEGKMLESEKYNNKAEELIAKKYPLGKWETVTIKGLELIKIMTKDIPQWKGIDVQDVWGNPSVFKKLVELAQKV